MKCSSCGYEYNDKLLKCPYCGSENTSEARRRQKQTMDNLNREYEDIRSSKGRIMWRSTRKGIRLGLIALAVAALAVVLTGGGIVVRNNLSARTVKRNLARMQEAMEQQDYEKICEILDHAEYFKEYERFYPPIGRRPLPLR